MHLHKFQRQTKKKSFLISHQLKYILIALLLVPPVLNIMLLCCDFFMLSVAIFWSFHFILRHRTIYHEKICCLYNFLCIIYALFHGIIPIISLYSRIADAAAFINIMRYFYFFVSLNNVHQYSFIFSRFFIFFIMFCVLS